MNQSEQLRFYMSELNRSKKWRKDDQYDESWRRWVDLYRGKQYEGASPQDRLIVNLAFATKNVLAPAVAIQNPRFAVNARKPEHAANAVITEEILNYQWRTHRHQSEFRLGVDDFLIAGHGWLKIGYKFVKTPEVKKSDEIDASGDDVEGVDDRDDTPGNTESEMILDDDRPYVERISIFDMFVDPDARHPKEMRWIAQRTWRALSDVRVDSRYSATARRNVGARSWSRWGSDDRDARDAGSQPDTGSIQYAEIIEFYDIRRNQVCTFAISGDADADKPESGFLIKPESIPYALGHPFVMMRNHEVPDHFYSMGDIEQIESLQMELNETRTQMMNHRKRFARKWVYEKDAFDRDGIAALESETDNAMIPVISDGDPSKVIAPIPAVITPPEFYNQSDLITNDIDRVSGVSDYMRGGGGDIKRTATEAAMIQDASNARAQDRLARIEDVLAQCGERIIALMQQYLTGEHVARVTSVPGNAWINYDKDYIQGKFDFDVQGGSTEPRNETFRRQSAMQLVDASMPFLEMGVANPVPLYRQILSKGFGIQDAYEYIQQPQQQQGAPAQGAPPPPGAPPPGAQPPGMPPGIVGPDQLGPQAPIAEPDPAAMIQGPPGEDIPPEMIQQLLAQMEGAGGSEITPEMLQMMMAEGGV